MFCHSYSFQNTAARSLHFAGAGAGAGAGAPGPGPGPSASASASASACFLSIPRIFPREDYFVLRVPV